MPQVADLASLQDYDDILARLTADLDEARADLENDEALRHLAKGAASDPDGSVHYQLFLLYRDLNRPDEARAALATSQRLRARGR